MIRKRLGPGIGLAIGLAAVLGAAALDADTLTRRGMAEYDQGDFKAAIADLVQATQKDSQDIEAFYYLANAYWRIDDDDKARAAFTRVAALDATGSFGSDARDWLSANGNEDVITRDLHIPTHYDAGDSQGQPEPPYTAADGRLHIVPPDGFTKDTDETSKASGGTRTRVVFTRQMRGGTARFLVEARYHKGAPSDSDRQAAIAGLSDEAERILAGLSLPDYDVIDSMPLDGGKELQVSGSSDGRAMRGMLRGFWSGDTFLFTAAVAPRSGWSTVSGSALTAMGAITIGTRTQAASGSAPASGSAVAAAASPSAAPTLSPDAPWWLRVQSQVATDAPGLQDPFATPAP